MNELGLDVAGFEFVDGAECRSRSRVTAMPTCMVNGVGWDSHGSKCEGFGSGY
jgi:hypothetical protein